MDDRLELRLHPAVMAACVATGVICIVIGLIALGGGRGKSAAVVALAAWAVGLLVVATAIRSRLLLTPDGFRARYLWSRRSVPWSAVREFWEAPGFLGAIWTPRGRFPLPTTRLQWARAVWGVSRYEIALFGASRRELVDTLNAWLQRYAGA